MYGTVATSSFTALTGSGTAATGNLIGQVVNKAGTGEAIDYGEVTIAGGVGYIAGTLAPFGATTLPGAVALGGVSATGQYGLIQLNNGGQITSEGVLLNATAGAAFGALTGPVPPRASNSALPFSEHANNPVLRDQAIVESYIGQMANVAAKSSLARGLVGAIGSNLDWPKAQEEKCRQFGC